MVQNQMGSWGISEQGWRKGPWTHEEDRLLIQYVTQNGEGRWSFVSKCAGLNRSGKSCRLRWVNYLRPGLKKGHITPQEEGIIIELHALWGNKWSTIARYLPGRTDNEIKNYWRTHFKKRKPTSDHDDVQIKQHKKKFIRQKQEEDTSTLEATSEDKNSNQDTTKGINQDTTKGIAYENKQYVPTTYQDSTNAPWPDFITVDSYLWDIGLWNFDDQSKMGIQNQDNNIANYSCEGDAIDHYVHNGEFVF